MQARTLRTILPTLAVLLAAACNDADTCVVTSVTDGDTFRCGETRVRLIGIDAPERGQFGGREATAQLRSLVAPGTTVRLEMDADSVDRYGRTLAYVYTRRGVLVNLEMARTGYALQATYPPNVRHVDEIRSAVQQARESGAGLWRVDGFQCTPKAHRSGDC